MFGAEGEEGGNVNPMWIAGAAAAGDDSPPAPGAVKTREVRALLVMIAGLSTWLACRHGGLAARPCSSSTPQPEMLPCAAMLMCNPFCILCSCSLMLRTRCLAAWRRVATPPTRSMAAATVRLGMCSRLGCAGLGAGMQLD